MSKKQATSVMRSLAKKAGVNAIKRLTAVDVCLPEQRESIHQGVARGMALESVKQQFYGDMLEASLAGLTILKGTETVEKVKREINSKSVPQLKEEVGKLLKEHK